MELYESGGEEALKELSRRKPLIKNRIPLEVEQAVVAFAIEQPAFGQWRASNELQKRGISVSPSGVANVWKQMWWLGPPRPPTTGLGFRESGLLAVFGQESEEIYSAVENSNSQPPNGHISNQLALEDIRQLNRFCPSSNLELPTITFGGNERPNDDGPYTYKRGHAEIIIKDKQINRISFLVGQL